MYSRVVACSVQYTEPSVLWGIIDCLSAYKLAKDDKLELITYEPCTARKFHRILNVWFLKCGVSKHLDLNDRVTPARIIDYLMCLSQQITPGQVFHSPARRNSAAVERS